MADPENQLRPAPRLRERAARVLPRTPAPANEPPAVDGPGVAPPELSRSLRWWLAVLAACERTVLVGVGVLLVAASVLLIVDTVRNVWRIAVEHGDLTLGLVNALGEVLLVIILMELLSTVATFLRHGGFALRQFLIIGIISSVRQILIVGAQLAVGAADSHEEFVHAEVELAVAVGVIVALACTLRLVGTTNDSVR